MATLFARTNVPPSVAVLPFMLARPQTDDLGWNVRSALAAAAAAERAHDGERRNSRARIAWLLCELGYQLTRRGLDRDQELPLSRIAIADSIGVSLCRVKRTLALLSLSQVAHCSGASLRIVDWRRLCSMAGYETRRLGLRTEDLEGEPLQIRAADDEPSNLVTASGEPACFV